MCLCRVLLKPRVKICIQSDCGVKFESDKKASVSNRDGQKESEPFKRFGSLKNESDPWLFFDESRFILSVRIRQKVTRKMEESILFLYSALFVSRLYYNA